MSDKRTAGVYREGLAMITRGDFIRADKCPECKVGELDTGYECINCGFDALPELQEEQPNERA